MKKAMAIWMVMALLCMPVLALAEQWAGKRRT